MKRPKNYLIIQLWPKCENFARPIAWVQLGQSTRHRLWRNPKVCKSMKSWFVVHPITPNPYASLRSNLWNRWAPQTEWFYTKLLVVAGFASSMTNLSKTDDVSLVCPRLWLLHRYSPRSNQLPSRWSKVFLCILHDLFTQSSKSWKSVIIHWQSMYWPLAAQSSYDWSFMHLDLEEFEWLGPSRKVTKSTINWRFTSPTSFHNVTELLFIGSLGLCLGKLLHPPNIAKFPLCCNYPEFLRENCIWTYSSYWHLRQIACLRKAAKRVQAEDAPLVLVTLVFTFPGKVEILLPTYVQREQQPVNVVGHKGERFREFTTHAGLVVRSIHVKSPTKDDTTRFMLIINSQ